MRKLVLASASPRRRELLEKLGLEFEVDPSNAAELLKPGLLRPAEAAKSLSLEKARSVAARHPDSIIIAADTFGVIDGRVLGKPHTSVEAKKMLRSMSGEPHIVVTGFTVIDTKTGRTATGSVETKVYIKYLTGSEIDEYVATGEPLDKAGAYAIQEKGAAIVQRIEGDYYNVVGLPLEAVSETLREFGVMVPAAPPNPPPPSRQKKPPAG